MSHTCFALTLSSSLGVVPFVRYYSHGSIDVNACIFPQAGMAPAPGAIAAHLAARRRRLETARARTCVPPCTTTSNPPVVTCATTANARRGRLTAAAATPNSGSSWSKQQARTRCLATQPSPPGKQGGNQCIAKRRRRPLAWLEQSTESSPAVATTTTKHLIS